MEEKSIKSFNPQEIAIDIINTIAKYEIPIDAIDIVFDAVEEEISKQKIVSTSTREKTKYSSDC